MEFLPYKFKKIGSPLIVIGLGLFYLYFKDIKPDWLDVPVFAVTSTYIETRSFQMVRTNLLDELGFIFVLLGLSLVVLTKEKYENCEKIAVSRYTAFVKSLQLTILMWSVIYLFVFGYVVFIISLGIFPFFVVTYYALFRYYYRACYPV